MKFLFLFDFLFKISYFSPYLEAVKDRGHEVLLFYDLFDELIMDQMQKFKEKVPFSIENDIIDESKMENVEDKLKDDTLPTTDQEKLVEWAKKVSFNIFVNFFMNFFVNFFMNFYLTIFVNFFYKLFCELFLNFF